MFYLIFILNFDDFYLYRLIWMISTILFLPKLTFSSDLISVQKLLIGIRFYQLHKEYIWCPNPKSFLGTSLAFSVVFRKLSEYLVMIKYHLFLLSDYLSLLALLIWEALLYFDHCENNLFYFVSICSCFEIFNYLCFWALSTSILEHESLGLTVVFIWVLRIKLRIIIM